jgi:S-formylglutathione hydrolase
MWSTLEIAGHRVDVFEPSGPPARSALIYLHDRDGKALRDLAAKEMLAQLHVAVISPQGGPCWWTDRIYPAFDPNRSVERLLMTDLLTCFADRFERFALAGIGMGGQGGLRLGFKHPEPFRIVAALEAQLDCHELYGSGTPLDEIYPSREHCRQDTAILHIHPARQPAHIWFACDPSSRWFRGNDRLHEKLSALAIPHTFAERAGTADEMLRFAADALAKEQRRLM